jgi:hypothetical protein
MPRAGGGPPPAVNLSIGAAGVVTAAIAGILLLVPTGDGSYQCDRPPGWLLVAPATESPLLRQDFFDEGYQCNRDARERGIVSVAALIVGGTATAALRWRRQATKGEAG